MHIVGAYCGILTLKLFSIGLSIMPGLLHKNKTIEKYSSMVSTSLAVVTISKYTKYLIYFEYFIYSKKG